MGITTGIYYGLKDYNMETNKKTEYDDSISKTSSDISDDTDSETDYSTSLSTDESDESEESEHSEESEESEKSEKSEHSKNSPQINVVKKDDIKNNNMCNNKIEITEIAKQIEKTNNKFDEYYDSGSLKFTKDLDNKNINNMEKNNNSDNSVKSDKSVKSDESQETDDDSEVDNHEVYQNIKNKEIHFNKIETLDDLIMIGEELIKKYYPKGFYEMLKKQKTKKPTEENENGGLSGMLNIIVRSQTGENNIKNKTKKENEKENEKLFEPYRSKSKEGLYYIKNEVYSVDPHKIVCLLKPLKSLKRMIGIEETKKTIFNMVISTLVDTELFKKSMTHSVIQGPPGVGKSKLGKIIGKIYSATGIVPENKFMVAQRSDFIGKYVGSTTANTKNVLNQAEGGVLFIDEAYTLTNEDKEHSDIYGKECINILNQELYNRRGKLVVILGGYKDLLDKNIFSQNPGLNRRFSFRITINSYNSEELAKIFIYKIKEIKWFLSSQISFSKLIGFFNTNYYKFPNYGGDVETLVLNCKIIHSKKAINIHPQNRKILTFDDIKEGFNEYIKNKNDEIDEHVKSMYI
jgi:hypothetical protein